MEGNMLQDISERGLLDRLAIGLSGLCAVHCAATALFLGALSSVGHVFTSPLVHEGGLALAIVIGGFALYTGAIRHGQLLPTAVGSLGLGMMAGALSLPHGEGEAIYTVLGVATVAFGHFLNHKASHRSAHTAAHLSPELAYA
ncbi:MAG: MerC domain-containing protein [Sphingobium sp.]